MNKEKSIIIKEIQEELGKYLNAEDVDRFCNVMKGNSSQLRTYNTEENNEIGLLQGTDKRAEIDSIITFAEDKLTEKEMIELLLKIAEFAYHIGEIDIATELSEDVLSKSKKTEEYENHQAEANLQLARIKWSQGYWNESKKCARKAYKTYTKNEDPIGPAKCENLLGTIYGEKGELKGAEEHFEKGISLLGDLSDLELLASLEMNLGIIYTMEKSYEKAENTFESSLSRYLKLDNKRLIARTLHNMGLLYTDTEDFDKAIEKFDESISISNNIGCLSNCAISYLGKANIYAELGKNEPAGQNADMAMELAYKI